MSRSPWNTIIVGIDDNLLGKVLLSKHESLSLVFKTHAKKLRVVVLFLKAQCVCGVERERERFLGFTGQSA